MWKLSVLSKEKQYVHCLLEMTDENVRLNATFSYVCNKANDRRCLLEKII